LGKWQYCSPDKKRSPDWKAPRTRRGYSTDKKAKGKKEDKQTHRSPDKMRRGQEDAEDAKKEI